MAHELKMLRSEVAELKAMLNSIQAALAVTLNQRPEPVTSSSRSGRDQPPTIEELAAAIASGDRTLLHAHNKRRRSATQRKTKGIYR